MALVKIGEFLFERKGRYKPSDREISSLHRLEKIDFNGNFHIGTKSSKTNMILIKQGDFVISGINVTKGAMGIYYGGQDVTATIHYSSYTFDESTILVEYFKRFLKSKVFINLLKEKVKGGIKTEIKSKHILPLEIDLPTLDEQQEIVDHFLNNESEMEDLASEITYQQMLLNRLRHQLLKDAISGKLTTKWREENPEVEPASELLAHIKTEKKQLAKDKVIKKQKPLPPISDNEIPFDLPNNWCWCRLGDAGLFERGKSKHRPRNDEILYSDGEYPFVQTGNVAQSKKNGYIIEEYDKCYNEKGLAQSRIWKAGTLCITIAANIAETGFLGIDACFPDSVVGFTSLADVTMPNYVRFFIDATKSDIERYAPATAQKNINLGIINELMLPLPPEKEIPVIMEKTEEVLIHIQQLETQSEKSLQEAILLTQAVLKEAFE